MKKSNFLSLGRAPVTTGDDADTVGRSAPLGGTRSQAMQRLQVGLSGIVVMILVIGLATVFTQRAQDTEEMSVPDAAPTTEPVDVMAGNDPLVDAGVVPELLIEEEEDVTQDPALTQEQGEFGENAEIEDTEAP